MREKKKFLFFFEKIVLNGNKMSKKLSKSCQKVVKKLSKSCQKVVKKLAKSWQKVSKLKNSQSPDKVTTAENSETVRGRRRGRGRIFVVPRPGATLSHLVKISFCISAA
jgi:mRNA-degrading endonuclease RelE of RelBE toxin-antitoxin system